MLRTKKTIMSFYIPEKTAEELEYIVKHSQYSSKSEALSDLLEAGIALHRNKEVITDEKMTEILNRKMKDNSITDWIDTLDKTKKNAIAEYIREGN